MIGIILRIISSSGIGVISRSSLRARVLSGSVSTNFGATMVRPISMTTNPPARSRPGMMPAMNMPPMETSASTP